MVSASWPTAASSKEDELNAIVEHKPTKLDEYRVQVLPPERAHELWRSMPSHIKPAVFERNLMNALMANPSLMDFDPRLIFREVAKAAALGLLLDPILGEGYIVTAYNYKTRKVEPQLRVGYKGMNKLARQSGNVANIYAHEVHALDDVECDLGFPKVFHHRPRLFGDRGDLIGYVAIITFKDGTFDFEPMSKEQCLGIRDRSDAWKAFVEKKIKSTPWSTDEVEMSKKTVLRRLMKRQEQSPELANALRIEDEAEHPNLDGLPMSTRLRVPSPTEVENSVIDHKDGDPTNNEISNLELKRNDPISSGPQPRRWLMPSIKTEYDSWFSKALDTIVHCPDGGELESFWNTEVKPYHETKDIFPSDYADLVDSLTKQQTKLNSEE